MVLQQTINRVAAFDRNRWPLWIGLGGRLPSESLAALPRIPQSRMATTKSDRSAALRYLRFVRTCRSTPLPRQTPAVVVHSCAAHHVLTIGIEHTPVAHT